jgi:L-lactate utilization protein LutB
LEKNVEWYMDKKIERTIEGLKKRNMEGYVVKDNAELIALLSKLIPQNSLVGVGDSMTLFETGVIDFLRRGNFTFLDKYREGITSEEKREIYLKNFSADTFMCSTNALTESGELYNIDGNGSRVAPMLYGPKQVILVAGVNKIVRDIEEAEKRVRQYVKKELGY